MYHSLNCAQSALGSNQKLNGTKSRKAGAIELWSKFVVVSKPEFELKSKHFCIPEYLYSLLELKPKLIYK